MQDRLLQALRQFVISLAAVVVVVLAWAVSVYAFKTPEYLAPSPLVVWAAFVKNEAVVFKNVAATGLSALGGLAIGSILAIFLAIAMEFSRRLERVLMLLLVIDQSIPKIALAPLVVIWFGAGVSSRVAIAVVVSFFPMIVNTHRGLRAVDRRFDRLLHSIAASPLDGLFKVRLPHATPYIISTLKIAAPLAVTGAIVAEYIQSNSGLGYMIMLALTEFNTPLIFVAVVAAAILSLALYMVAATLPSLLLGRRFGVLIRNYSRQ